MDLEEDANFFNILGRNMTQLKWLSCQILGSSKMTTKNNFRKHDENGNRLVPEGVDLEYHQDKIFDSPLNSSFARYEHRHLNLIQGISLLKNLRVLILKEDDYFDTEERCSLFDDKSLLSIIESCRHIIKLDIETTLRCNGPNYCRQGLNHCRTNVDDINHVLNDHFTSEQQYRANELQPSQSAISLFQKLNSGDQITTKPIASSPPASVLDAKQQSTSTTTTKLVHSITDLSLSQLDAHLPGLKILKLRGVRLGPPTLASISKLKKLKFLGLDSIQFTKDVDMNRVALFSQRLQSKHQSSVIIRITNIPWL